MSPFAPHGTRFDTYQPVPEAQVKKVCPWFYQMKALIAERPNAKPVGIGDSTSELDLDALMPGTQNDASSPEDAEPITLSEDDDGDEDNEAEGQRRARNKRSASVAGLEEDTKPKPGTPAHPNVSKPTTAGTKPKKLKGLEELVEIAAAEEGTCQKELDLKIQKSKDKASMIKAKAELQKATIEAKKEKAKQAHEVEMMKLQLQFAKIRQVAPGISEGIPTQLSECSDVHSSGVYPAFSPGFGFDDGSQLDGTTSANGGLGEGGFE